MNPNVGGTTIRIMRALRKVYPCSLPKPVRPGLSQKIADDVNSTRKYVADCVHGRRGLESPAGQHLLSVYKSTGRWKMAWDDTMSKYPGQLAPSRINEYRTVAVADPVFSRDLPF